MEPASRCWSSSPIGYSASTKEGAGRFALTFLEVRAAVDDHDTVAREQAVDDEPDVDARRVLADHGPDLRHDLLRGNGHAERGGSDRRDLESLSVLEQDDRACPARPIECAGAFEDGAGERVTDYRQVQVGHARNLNVARQVLRRQAATHSAPRVAVCAPARFQRRHADEWRLAGGTEPADPDDHDRVDARERVVDAPQDRRAPGVRLALRVWCLDLKRHDATGIAEGGLQEPLAREAVRELLLLPGGDVEADEDLLASGGRG